MKRTIITVILTLAFTAFAIQAVEQRAFSGAGIVESTTGGFMFPDGTVQLTAANPPCTAITYLPFTILEEGVYCFTGHLETSMTSGNAIEINVDDVVIDLNSWKLDGSGAGSSSTALGIYAFDKKRITIRNGTIRGFYRGISLAVSFVAPTNSRDHLVHDILAIENLNLGMKIHGIGSVVRNNTILRTGGTENSAGLSVAGSGADIVGNNIFDTYSLGTGIARGILLESANSVLVKNNRIKNTTHSGSGTSIGIASSLTVRALFEGNEIINTVSGTNGISAQAGDFCIGNIVMNFTTAFVYCVDGGNTVHN